MRISFLCLLAVPLLLLGACDDDDMDCHDGTDLDDLIDECPNGPGTHDAGDSGQTELDAGPCRVCSGDTPLCRESDGECVACLSDAECGGQRCDIEAGECVECPADADCTEPGAARCDVTTGQCASCDDSTQCEGIAGRGVCGGGECVECAAGETTACSDSPCKSDNTCSSDRGAAALPALRRRRELPDRSLLRAHAVRGRGPAGWVLPDERRGEWLRPTFHDSTLEPHIPLRRGGDDCLRPQRNAPDLRSGPRLAR